MYFSLKAYPHLKWLNYWALAESVLRVPLKIHFGGQANLFDSDLRQTKAALASTKADLSSLSDIKNLLLAAQKQLLEPPLKPSHKLNGVFYFSAYVKWKKDNYLRHQNYVTMLRSAGVEFVQGRFKKKDCRCHLCGRIFQTYEEKQTDVNIAIRLLSDAVEDKFDRAVIVSADSDLTPVILAVRKLFPEKKGVLCFQSVEAVVN